MKYRIVLILPTLVIVMQELSVPMSKVSVKHCMPKITESDASVALVECNDSDVRLFHFAGDNENEGRVEFCSSGRWILVCNDLWDNDDATVLCRQLGYNVDGKYPYTDNICSTLLSFL